MNGFLQILIPQETGDLLADLSRKKDRPMAELLSEAISLLLEKERTHETSNGGRAPAQNVGINLREQPRDGHLESSRGVVPRSRLVLKK
jgi:hypothetical protein